MSNLNVGQLTASFDVDPSGAEAGITQAELAMHGLQRDAAQTATRIRSDFNAALRRLPTVRLDANSTPLDHALQAARQNLRDLAAERIGITISTDEARTRLASLQTELEAIARERPSPEIAVQVGQAYEVLESLQLRLDTMAREDVAVRVHVDAERAREQLARVQQDSRDAGQSMGREVEGGSNRASRALTSLAGVFGQVVSVAFSSGSMMGIGISAAIPTVMALVGSLVNILPAAAVATTALLSVAQAAAAIKIGLGGVGAAFKQALAPATGGGGAAAKNIYAVRDAQRALKDAVLNAAQANQRAAQQTASAERNLTDAQKAARQAQLDLNDARKQATRDLQDMNNNLADAQLSQRQAIIDVQDAQQQLDADKKAGSKVSAEQLAKDQLAYDQAVQRLKEQQQEVQRLQSDTAAANKAGVEGSQTVLDAKQKILDANRNVGDQEQALANARQQQAITERQGLEAIQRAQEALAQAQQKSAAGGAAVANAMAKLAPAAQAFVREVLALRPAWDALRLDVQQALFAGLADRIRAAAASILPVLRRELTSSASALNAMAAGALTAGQQLADSGVLGRAMHSASAGLHNLASVPGQLITGFVQLAAAAGPAFQRLTSGVAGVASQVAGKLSSAFQSGALQQAIETAIGLIKQLMGFLGNVGSIFVSVFTAAQSAGGGMLGVLSQLAASLRQVFASAPVQDGLRALFTTMQTLASTVAPLLAQAVGLLGPVLAALGPPVQTLITALGQALSPILTALGPVLLAAAQAVGGLLAAVSPLLPVAGQLIGMLGPILTPILAAVGQAFRAVAPVVAALAKALQGALAPVLAALPKIIQPLMLIFTTLVEAYLPVLTQLVVALTPALVSLGDSFGQILTALAPVIEQLAVLLGQYLQTMVPILTPIIQIVGQLATILAGTLARLISSVVVPAIRALAALLQGHFSQALGFIKQAISGWISFVVSVFTQLPRQLADALGPLAKRLVDKIDAATGGALRAIGTWIRNAYTEVQTFPVKILNALGDLGSLLYNAGQDVVSGLWNGIKSMGSWLVSTLTSWVDDVIPGPIRKALQIGSPSRLMRDQVGRWIPAGIVDGIQAGVPALRATMARLVDAPGVPAMAGAGVGAVGFGLPTPRSSLHIEHYHESPAGSARSTAEELWWLGKGRG